LFKNFSNYSGVALLRFLAALPYKTLVSIGYGLGSLAAFIPSDRNRVVQKNLELCFPALSNQEINRLRKQQPGREKHYLAWEQKTAC
jgi:KDO2-lipid IV(A) lauroyltransferase